MIVTTGCGKLEATTRDGVVEALGIPFARAATTVGTRARRTMVRHARRDGVRPRIAATAGRGVHGRRHAVVRGLPVPQRMGARGRRRERAGAAGHGVDPRRRVPARFGRAHALARPGARRARRCRGRHRQLPPRRARLSRAPGTRRRRRVCGNWGVLDLVAALQWIRDEIGAFGGDAGNVTLFGESAGGTLVSLLGASRAASGLFRRMIVQSGVPTAITLERAGRLAEEVAEQVGVARRARPARRAGRRDPRRAGRTGVPARRSHGVHPVRRRCRRRATSDRRARPRARRPGFR